MTKEEILTKEIDLIQGCINRMAQNSFMIKGWCITIVTALIAFLDKNINAFILGFIFIIPILAFWYLDSFFLLTERLYRRKYEWVIKNRLTSDENFFDLNPNSFKDVKKDKEIKIMFSKTLRWFYLMLLGTVLLVTIIIGFSQNKKQLAEQGKIAETLSVWDSAIEKTEKLISEKEKMFNGISQKIFRKAGIKHKISEFLTIRNEKCIPDDSTPLYSLTIEDGVTPKSDRYDREALVKDSEEKEYKVVYPGDIVFNPANLRWGAIARSNETKKVAVSPIYEVLQLDSSKINSDYLTFLLTSKDKIRYYATKTEGTLVERMAVKVDVFLNFEIEIEEDNENQKTVSEVLTTLIREISLLKKQLEQYKLQKQGLMQKLLTGEWRVR